MAKIMICDDAAFMRMMIKDILTKNGYEIAAEAENGAVAVEKYPDAKPDLVLMDITMPDMDGIQALKKIKEIDPNANIIMCSAMGQQAMVIEAIQSGAKDFIVKPFQAEREQFYTAAWRPAYFSVCSCDYLFHNQMDWWISEGPDVRTQLSGGRYHTDRQQQTGSGNKNGRCVSCDRGCKR